MPHLEEAAKLKSAAMQMQVDDVCDKNKKLTLALNPVGQLLVPLADQCTCVIQRIQTIEQIKAERSELLKEKQMVLHDAHTHTPMHAITTHTCRRKSAKRCENKRGSAATNF